ncbi:hypothetical protein D6783_05845, partial [Candidatus Woesearchaeota archaeon]
QPLTLASPAGETCQVFFDCITREDPKPEGTWYTIYTAQEKNKDATPLAQDQQRSRTTHEHHARREKQDGGQK